MITTTIIYVVQTLVPEHPAYWYLADAFGLKQLPLTRISSNEPLSPAQKEEQRKELEVLWKNEGVKTIFREHSKGENGDLITDPVWLYIQELANQHNVDLRYLSSLEAEPERAKGADIERTYIEAMELINIPEIKKGLKC